MDTSTLGFALKISGIGIVVLLLVLAALAGIVYLMTRFIVDKEEPEEEGTVEETPAPAAAAVEEKKTDLTLAAAIAVAIARAQAEMNVVSSESAGETVNAWYAFGLQRRLTQSSTIRRTK
jgi:sodium pump decarboxylase gamma subunit